MILNHFSSHVINTIQEAIQVLERLNKTIDDVPKEILLQTLGVEEALKSNDIEGIHSTRSDVHLAETSIATKDENTLLVKNYKDAIIHGYKRVQKGMLTINDIIDIQAIIVGNTGGIRKLPGTVIKNISTGEVIHTPPQEYVDIIKLMGELEDLINNGGFGFKLSIDEEHPLIQLALIHHKFERIHPFYDGNGRTGRIINVLYLILKGYLKTPALCLSSYINSNKTEYYRLLRLMDNNECLEEWILFIIKGVIHSSQVTENVVREIQSLMESYKEALSDVLKGRYVKTAVRTLFLRPYIEIKHLVKEVGIYRTTASQFLHTAISLGLLEEERKGRNKIYINAKLLKILSNTYK